MFLITVMGRPWLGLGWDRLQVCGIAAAPRREHQTRVRAAISELQWHPMVYHSKSPHYTVALSSIPTDAAGCTCGSASVERRRHRAGIAQSAKTSARSRRCWIADQQLAACKTQLQCDICACRCARRDGSLPCRTGFMWLPCNTRSDPASMTRCQVTCWPLVIGRTDTACIVTAARSCTVPNTGW